MIFVAILFGIISILLGNYLNYLKNKKKLNSLGYMTISKIRPKRRFLTEKSQIPKTVKESKRTESEKVIFFTTPKEYMKSPLVALPSRQTPSYYPEKIAQDKLAQDKLAQDRDVGQFPSTDYIPRHQVNIDKSQDRVNYFQNSAILDSTREKKKMIEKPAVITTRNEFQENASHKKRSFSEEEMIQVKKSRKSSENVKYKTPKGKDLQSLKRKSTFTVLEKSEIDKEFLPEEGWITPMSRRLGRRAYWSGVRNVKYVSKNSVMCQTTPVILQESKRIKVTPAVDRVKSKIPDSISKPLLHGNELDEKTVQVLLSAVGGPNSASAPVNEKESVSTSPFAFKMNGNSSEKSLEPAFKVPLPLAKENISPVASTEKDVSVPAPAPSEPVKFNFNTPSSVVSSVPSTVSTTLQIGASVSAAGSPGKPAFSFSVPGATTPILSTVSASDSTPKVPQFSFGAANISETPKASLSFNFGAASTAASLPSVPATTSVLPSSISTPDLVSKSLPNTIPSTSSVSSGATFNFGKPLAPPSSTEISATTFNFGQKAAEAPAVPVSKPLTTESPVTSVPSGPVFSFGSSTSTSAPTSLTPSTKTASTFSFGQTPAPTFSLGSANTTSAPTLSVSQPALIPQSFGTTSASTSQSLSFGNAPFGQSQAPVTPSFGSVNATPATAAATPSFSQSIPEVSSTFGKSTPSTNAPFGQAMPAPSPFGNSTTAPFGQPSTSISLSTFGQQAAAAPPTFGQQTSTPSFGQQTSVAPFGQSSAAPMQSSPFGQQNPAPVSGSFGSSAPFGQTSSAFGQPSSTTPAPFGQSGTTPAPFGQSSGTSGFGSSTGNTFGQGASNSTSFGQSQPSAPSFSQGSTAPSFNQATQPSSFGGTSTPFGSSNSTGFSFPAQQPPAPSGSFGSQAHANAPPPISTFSFGQPSSGASSFSFGVSSPVSPGFSFNAGGGPQMPQMPSGTGFSLGAGGDTTRKLAQPKGRLRKAGLRR